jgi:cyclic pyranopterin phosphate synthase
MVDISEKAVTRRTATARGRVNCTAEVVQLIAGDAIAKGSVLDTASPGSWGRSARQT